MKTTKKLTVWSKPTKCNPFIYYAATVDHKLANRVGFQRTAVTMQRLYVIGVPLEGNHITVYITQLQ